MSVSRLSRSAIFAAAALAGSEYGQAAAGGDRAFGEYLSAECVTCHQVTGQATGGIPAIVAWPEDQFIAVMQAYKAKDRDNNVMQTMAGRLSKEEIEALAAYFGSLPIQPLRN
ncbi:MAG: c-type cytochrome [Beijerinckiaceae bacterium]|jgi:cytochrome c553|nr:c-type cytochrome [Beijerinckiaceae bacterium]MDO9439510.1 c-type cytochrome [Beijerinckiaceae bacterium]